MLIRVIFSMGLFASLLFADFSRDATKGIVTDSATGLMWQDNEVVTSVKDDWDEYSYTYTSNIYMNWGNAVTYCGNLNLGGYDDWRLPSIDEFSTVYFYPGDTVFSNLSPRNKASWTSTSVTGEDAAYVMYSEGGISNSGKIYSDYTRCVRGVQFFNLNISTPINGIVTKDINSIQVVKDTNVTFTAIPNEGFKFTSWGDNNTSNPRTITVTTAVNLSANFIAKTCEADSYNCPVSTTTGTFTRYSDETIKDTATNLSWQDNIDTKQSRTWDDAVKYCEDLSFAGFSDWRLPSKTELKTLVDTTTYKTNTAFINNIADAYWSITPKTDYTAYYVEEGGYESSTNKTTAFYTRCVKSAISQSPTLSISLIAGWNLASTPVDYALTKEDLGSKFGEDILVWTYDPSTATKWAVYTNIPNITIPSNINTIQSIPSGAGFWVKMPQAKIVDFSDK